MQEDELFAAVRDLIKVFKEEHLRDIKIVVLFDFYDPRML